MSKCVHFGQLCWILNTAWFQTPYTSTLFSPKTLIIGHINQKEFQPYLMKIVLLIVDLIAVFAPPQASVRSETDDNTLEFI